jgi:glycosyltransferase involved in cell wall biosynthesis
LKTRSVAVLLAVCSNDNPAYFKIALESVLDQDTDAEIRIYLGIDGPISVALQKVIDELHPRLYKIIRNNNDAGLSNVLNELINNLSDEVYIFRMDADDVSLRERFETQINFMDEHPEVDVCGSAIIETDFTDYSKIIGYPLLHEQIKGVIHRRNPLAHPTICFRRKVLLHESYPEKYKVNQDLALWGTLLHKGYRFANLKEPLLLYRSTDVHIKRSRVEVSTTELEIYKDIIKKLKLNPLLIVFPYLRYFFRLLPSKIQKYIYQSFLRNRL